MKPEPLSILGMYGNRKVFQQKFNEGYAQIAFGTGPWVEGNQRIVGLFAFYHPDGKIATYESPKVDVAGSSVRGQPYEASYTSDSFDQHIKTFQIRICERSSLENLLKQWSEE